MIRPMIITKIYSAWSTDRQGVQMSKPLRSYVLMVSKTCK